jgi:hypothetical protein
MAKCQIKGCNNNTPPGKKLCTVHYTDIIGNGGKFKPGNKPGKKKPGPVKGPKGPTGYQPGPRRKNTRKPAPQTPRAQTFTLRGHTLTINYSHKVKHINIDRLTRAVKFNEEARGTNGNYYKYTIQLKQGVEVLETMLFESKAERERDFIKLQNILASIY